MISPSSVPKGSRSVSQLKRSQGTVKCKNENCERTISGNKIFCREHTPEDSENEASLIVRLQRVS